MKVIDLKNNLEELKNNTFISDYEMLIADSDDGDLDAWVDVKIEPIMTVNNITVNFHVEKI
jgi:hypothetical protein